MFHFVVNSFADKITYLNWYDLSSFSLELHTLQFNHILKKKLVNNHAFL